MNQIADFFEGVRFRAAYERRGNVLHWRARLFCDVDKPAEDITGVIERQLKSGADDLAHVQNAVEQVILGGA